jgi:hypothetical protein
MNWRGEAGPTPAALRALLGAAIAVALAAWASAAGAAQKGSCQRVAEGVLLLRGPTDEAMLQCLRASAGPGLRTLVVNSIGGSVIPAIRMAELIEPLDLELVVRGNCNSSCANYLLPVARRVRLEPGATVLLHGSIDDNILAEGGSRETYELQRAYTERNSVHRGWLLFRTAEDAANGRHGAYVSGNIETWGAAPSDANLRFILVEERFMRSCLKNVEIAPFVDTLAQRAYLKRGLQARLARQGIYPSGTLVCRAPEIAG